MNRAEELAQAYADAVSTHRLESLYGTSKSYTLEKALERDEAHAALSAELRRLSAVEAELIAQLAEQRQAAKTWENEAERRSDRYTKCAAELIALKKAISEAEPVAWLYTELRTAWSPNGTPYKQLEVSTNPFFSRMDSAQPLYTLKGIK